MATLGQAIAIARIITNDTDATSYARPDATLLQFANDALDEIARRRPSLFYADADFTCAANTASQVFNVADSIGLVDVRNIKNGASLRRIPSDVYDSFVPGWRSMTAAPAESWYSIDNNDEIRKGLGVSIFDIYPPAPAGQILVCRYIQRQAEYAAIATHPLPESWTPVIADYIIWQMDAMEDEFAVGGRAVTYRDQFFAKLGG